MSRKAKIVIGILSFLLIGAVVYYVLVLRLERVTVYNGEYGDPTSDTSCTVLGINMHGDLATYVPQSEVDNAYVSSDDVLYSLFKIKKGDAPHIQAVMLDIDSYGGSPVAAEELANTLRSLSVPVVAVVRSAATSGGYWVASASEYIVASALSDIGGIGVTMSYLDESKLNQQDGYTWNTLSSGVFKDSGSPEKPLTKEERALFERDIAIIHEAFVRAVATNRQLPYEKVSALADGATMLGEAARAQGLIDAIGFIDEAETYLKNTHGIDTSHVCWQ